MGHNTPKSEKFVYAPVFSEAAPVALRSPHRPGRAYVMGRVEAKPRQPRTRGNTSHHSRAKKAPVDEKSAQKQRRLSFPSVKSKSVSACMGQSRPHLEYSSCTVILSTFGIIAPNHDFGDILQILHFPDFTVCPDIVVCTSHENENDACYVRIFTATNI